MENKNIANVEKELVRDILTEVVNEVVKELEQNKIYCGELKFSKERNAEGHWDTWYEPIQYPEDGDWGYGNHRIQYYKAKMYDELIQCVKSTLE